MPSFSQIDSPEPGSPGGSAAYPEPRNAPSRADAAEAGVAAAVPPQMEKSAAVGAVDEKTG